MKKVVLATCVALVACSATPAPVSKAPTSTPSASATPSMVPEPAPSSSSDVPVVHPDPAAVKSPVFSDDDCSADKDCVPMNTCHPDHCMLAQNAGTMPTGMMCTMDCRGGTLDCNFNHCGCAPNAEGKKKCAVLPGPRRKGS